MSETNDTEEITDGNFLINLKLIYQYQNKDPILLAEYKQGMYKTGSFC